MPRTRLLLPPGTGHFLFHGFKPKTRYANVEVTQFDSPFLVSYVHVIANTRDVSPRRVIGEERDRDLTVQALSDVEPIGRTLLTCEPHSSYLSFDDATEQFNFAVLVQRTADNLYPDIFHVEIIADHRQRRPWGIHAIVEEPELDLIVRKPGDVRLTGALAQGHYSYLSIHADTVNDHVRQYGTT